MRKFTKRSLTILCSTLLLHFGHPLHGTPFTWTAFIDNDLDNALNWVPFSVPTAGDSATFHNLALNLFPTLSSLSLPPQTFSIDLISFPNGVTNAPTYNFLIQDGTQFNVVGSTLIPSGVDNESTNPQFFNIFNSGEMTFNNFSIAAFSFQLSPQMVGYNLGALGTPGFLTFNNFSQAGYATISATTGSTVTFNGASFPSTATLITDDTSSINLAQITNQNFTATLLGTGTVNKTGPNLLNFISNNGSFAGTTNIDNGNLALNNFLGGNVNINSGGTLSGLGTVIGNVAAHSGSTIFPGNGSIGTINIVDNFSSDTGATYQVLLDAPKNASLINVGERAELGGGTVNVTPSFFQTVPNKEFSTPIVFANVAVEGTFSDVTTSAPLLTFSLAYDQNHVFLKWINSLALIPNTPNQEAVTDQLQTIINPTRQELRVLTKLLMLSPDEQALALDQLSAVQYTFLTDTAEIVNRKFIRRLYDPLRKIITTQPCCDKCFRSLVDVWFDVGADKTNIKRGNCIEGFSGNGTDVTLGLQFRKDPTWTSGMAVAYEHDKNEFKLGGKATSDNYLGGIYTLWRPADYYLLGDFVASYGQYHVHRPIDIGRFHFRSKGLPRIYQGTLYVEGGKDFYLHCSCHTYLFQPFLGFETTYGRFSRIQEHSSDPLFNVDIKDRIRSATYGRLGIHFSAELFSRLTVAADFAWQYRLTSHGNHITEHFQQFGNEFTIHGAELPRDSVDWAVNLATTVASDFRIYAEASGQVWNNGYTNNLFAGFQIGW